MNRKTSILAVVAFAVMSVGFAKADGLTVYGAYNGSTTGSDTKLANSSFNVSIGPGTCVAVSSNPCADTTYQVDYTIKFGNAMGSAVAPSGEGTNGAALVSVGFMAFNQSFVSPTTFNSLTINGVSQTASWGVSSDVYNGTVNASGCSQNSNGGWFCSKDTVGNPLYQLAPQNGTFVFTFTVTAPTGAYITSPSDWSIKAEFCNPNTSTGTCTTNYDILSMNGGAPGQPPTGVTPEPAGLVLLGTGLLGFGGYLKKFARV